MLVSSVEQSAIQALETQVLVFIGLPDILYSGRDKTILAKSTAIMFGAIEQLHLGSRINSWLATVFSCHVLDSYRTSTHLN